MLSHKNRDLLDNVEVIGPAPTHVVTFSYGIGSWAAAKRVVEKHGTDNVILLQTDTNYEDEDTYRWGEAAAKDVGVRLEVIADGRNPWEVFHDVGMIGNSMFDPCSRVLKRELLLRWLNRYCRQDVTCVYFGIHWSEADRFSRYDRRDGRWKGIKHRMIEHGWKSAAPLCEPPLVPYEELHRQAERAGLWKQRLYQLGFSHANCGGRCVKQGHGGWRKLLEVFPDRYAECERNEQKMRERLGKDVSILKDRRGGVTRPLTLGEFRERVRGGQECDDVYSVTGGCNCFGAEE